jgi:MFS family permease
MLDSFDVMLYSLVLAALMADLHLSKETAGLLGSLTLVAAAAGGILFGFLADRFGRARAMVWSMLIYAVSTGACGLVQNVAQLAVLRIVLGLGMGGEWASGAALVSETWPGEHRGKALALMQSSWAVGYALAAAVTAIVLPLGGWRAVFYTGLLPALLTLWIRRNVREPEIWASQQAPSFSAWGRIRELFQGSRATITVALMLMNACTLFAWWGFNLWVPAYLSLPTGEGGIGLSPRAMAGLVIAMQIGMWFGYISFGFISDAIGRRPTYVAYLLMAAVLLLLYASTRSALVLLLLGPCVAFFGTGYFSGFGAVTAELYPTRIRASGQGLTYNVGRIASAAAPFLVGSVAANQGFSFAFILLAGVFVLATVFWMWIPETRGLAKSTPLGS